MQQRHDAVGGASETSRSARPFSRPVISHVVDGKPNGQGPPTGLMSGVAGAQRDTLSRELLWGRGGGAGGDMLARSVSRCYCIPFRMAPVRGPARGSGRVIRRRRSLPEHAASRRGEISSEELRIVPCKQAAPYNAQSSILTRVTPQRSRHPTGPFSVTLTTPWLHPISRRIPWRPLESWTG